jgi:hypothetical protein
MPAPAAAGVLSATLQQQQEQVLALAADNANLAAEASLLRWEASSAEFLRREIMRLRNVRAGLVFACIRCFSAFWGLQLV